MNAQTPIIPADLSQLSERELRKLENKIARKHSGMFPWGAVAWAFGNMAVWLALWPLVLLGYLPLWAAFPIATVNMALVYLPTHEAQHDIIARPGTQLRWLNELVGHATSWMLVYPFEVLRITHLDHHRHTNDPDLDVDFGTKASGPWSAIWNSIQGRQPGDRRNHDYAASLVRAGRTDLIVLSLAYKVGFMGVLGTLAWNGYALEALLLWWLPLQIAITYIIFFLSWAPHHPGNEQGRYRNTRSWRSKLGNIGSMGMQFHIVHHLHPYIPLYRTPAAYREMKPILEARGCRLEDL
jgi:beta-carotene hydroxylase